jgi:hypothetical protein
VNTRHLVRYDRDFECIGISFFFFQTKQTKNNN